MKKYLLAAALIAFQPTVAAAKPSADTAVEKEAGRDAGQGAVRFWDRIGERSCFGLSRAYYAEYLATLGLNYGDSWTVGTGEAHELNQQWTEMWCR